MSSDEAVAPGAEACVKTPPRKLIAKIHPLLEFVRGEGTYLHVRV